MLDFAVIVLHKVGFVEPLLELLDPPLYESSFFEHPQIEIIKIENQITFLLLINSVYSQKEVVANDFGKNFNGISFGILKNNGFALVDTLGNVTADKITFKKYDKNLTTFSFYEGVTYDFDNNSKLYRLIDFNKVCNVFIIVFQ
mgnify:CR=1 FL=1